MEFIDWKVFILSFLFLLSSLFLSGCESIPVSIKDGVKESVKEKVKEDCIDFLEKIEIQEIQEGRSV